MSQSDLHMTMILPEDISERISLFIGGSLDFPFIKKEEVLSILYLYGRNIRIASHPEKVLGIAKKTVEIIEQSIETYRNGSKSIFDSEFLRTSYIRRQLQITVDNNVNKQDKNTQNLNKRIINDPVILSECFSQHVAFYEQKYSFFIYGPLKDGELTTDIRDSLSGRIVMLGYNKQQEQLPFDHPILPFYVWAKENLVHIN